MRERDVKHSERPQHILNKSCDPEIPARLNHISQTRVICTETGLEKKKAGPDKESIMNAEFLLFKLFIFHM